jgi:hypothetical protein
MALVALSFNTSGSNYETVDGSFIRFVFAGSGEGTLYYSDGTIVEYAASGGGYRSYPVRITDRTGITSTFHIREQTARAPNRNRYGHPGTSRFFLLRFERGPGHDRGSGLSGELQVMRFYYDDVTIPGSGLFASPIYSCGVPGTSGCNETATMHVLKYVYLPMSSDGSSPIYTAYQFDYSEYGMIYQTKQLRGVTASTTSQTTAGTLRPIK